MGNTVKIEEQPIEPVHWHLFEEGFKDMSIGGTQTWGINDQNKILSNQSGSWTEEKELPNESIPDRIYVGKDDTVMCLSTENHWFRYIRYAKNWLFIAKNIKDVALNNNANCYVLTTKGDLRRYIGETRFWDIPYEKEKGPIYSNIDIGEDNILFAFSYQYDLLYQIAYYDGQLKNFYKQGDFMSIPLLNVIGASVASFSDMMFIDRNRKLLSYKEGESFRVEVLEERRDLLDDKVDVGEAGPFIHDFMKIVHDKNGKYYLLTKRLKDYEKDEDVYYTYQIMIDL